MENNYILLKNKLKKYGQEQLLNYYDELNEQEKNQLLDDILNIDFEQIERLYSQTKVEDKIRKDKIEAISYIDKQKLTKEIENYYCKIGKQSIENNEYAVVTMAGGQRNKTRS